MLSYLPSGISGLRFLFSAIVAFGIVSVPTTTAQSSTPTPTWLVTVDVTKPNVNGSWEIPNYSVGPEPGSPQPHTCTSSVPTSPDKGDVLVCPGDAVHWKAVTTSPGAFITVYEKDGVLLNNNVPPHWFHNNPNQPNQNIGAATDSANPQTGAHGYAIAVYDPGATQPRPKLVLDDPQIVIGSGTPYALIQSMRQNCGELSRSIERNDPQKALANRLCDQIDALAKIFRLP